MKCKLFLEHAHSVGLNIYSRIKYVINLFPNVRSQAQELAIDAMQSGL